MKKHNYSDIIQTKCENGSIEDMDSKVQRIGGVTLVYDDYMGQDLYVDGSEEKLLNIVQKHSQEEYEKVIEEECSWPILYHLSHMRSNVIEWLPFNSSQKVLEIGSGCGAITGTLAEKVRRVDCIELSRQRSLINAYRNKEKDNISIRVGNFQDIEKKLEEKYDYITLVGVLEYADSYIQGEKPYHTFLNMIKNHLALDGKVVIAIENKFGLKYWAGCKEDHLGRYYVGLEGYHGTNSVCTFSRDELVHMAHECGFNEVDVYYPYPDYKFTQVVYSDEYLPKLGELNINYRNFDGERIVNFDESKVFDEIIKDGKFPFFSNSFLIVLGDK